MPDTDKFYMALIEAENKIWLMLTDDNAIRAFRTEREALAHFEDAYQGAHARGYEASMSACINWMYFQPSIIHASLEDVKHEIIAVDAHAFTLRSIAGSIDAANTQPKAREWFEKGMKPRLIHEEVEY